MTIIDKNLRIVHCEASSGKLCKGIPVFKSVSKILWYVASRYFTPSLDNLEPYAYAGQLGKGWPSQLPMTTMLSDLKFMQKDRRVGVDRLNIVGRSELHKDVIFSRYKA